MAERRIFIDTEFTTISLDSGPDLISIGFVDADDPSAHLYVELTDGWRKDECSTFVLMTVLPLLGRHNPELLSRAQAAARIEKWLHERRGGDASTQIACLSDSDLDWQFFRGLYFRRDGDWAAQNNIVGRLVNSEFEDRTNGNILVQEGMLRFWERRENERHHALIDALALHAGWQFATEQMS